MGVNGIDLPSAVGHGPQDILPAGRVGNENPTCLGAQVQSDTARGLL